MNQTLYAGGRLSSLQRQAIAGKDQANATLMQTAVEVMEAVGVAWANLQVQAASITATEEQVNAAQTAFDGVRQEAEVGSRTTLDVLDAEQELLDARNDRLRAAGAALCRCLPGSGDDGSSDGRSSAAWDPDL